MSAQLCALYAYWQGRLNGRAMPSRADIDPFEIKPLLPNVMVVEALEDGQRFRYRLAGTAITNMTGRELSGRYVDEALPGNGYRDYVIGLYRKLVCLKRPIYSECDYISPSGLERTTKRLMLPLSSDGATVNMVLAGQLFESLRSQAYPPPVFSLDGFHARTELVLEPDAHLLAS
jgi:hypothetical protein